MDPSTDEPLHLHQGVTEKSLRLHLTKSQDGLSRKQGQGAQGL